MARGKHYHHKRKGHEQQPPKHAEETELPAAPRAERMKPNK